MTKIVKSARRSAKLKVHAELEGRPACGGGCGARMAQWQQTLLEVDCRRCRKILLMDPIITNKQNGGEENECKQID